MPTQAPAKIDSNPQTSRNLEFYRTRDEFVRSYQPATEEERLLLTHMVRAWLRLQKFYDLENEIIEREGLSSMFHNDLERYKVLTRTVAEAERMWRNALAEFQKAKARRESKSLDSPRRRSVSTALSVRPTAAVEFEEDADSKFRAPLPPLKPQ